MEITGAASDTPASLTLATPQSGVELVRQLLTAAYDISYDDALLRGAVVGAGAVEVRDNFDRLRKQYRFRRELSGTHLKSPPIPEGDRRILEALGCTYEQSGD